MTINLFLKQIKVFFKFLLLFGLVSCASSIEGPLNEGFIQNKQDPAISGNGEKLAFIINQLGRPTVQLQNLQTGKLLPIRHFTRHHPHSSPSLSWSGRYLAVIMQRGNRRLIAIEDRITGRLYSFPLMGERNPIRATLSPDAQKIAIQVAHQGKWKVELFDLSQFLEPDLLGMNISR